MQAITENGSFEMTATETAAIYARVFGSKDVTVIHETRNADGTLTITDEGNTMEKHYEIRRIDNGKTWITAGLPDGKYTYLMTAKDACKALNNISGARIYKVVLITENGTFDTNPDY